MSKLKQIQRSGFDHIVHLIEAARNQAFSKVNAELVLLYYNVGKLVSSKIADGVWGEGTVEELAKHIATKMPGISGFNRRGLYRMKQFYEVYSVDQFVSPLATQLRSWFTLNKKSLKVSALPGPI